MPYQATGDRKLFILTSVLTIFGLVMVYSASSVVATSKHGMSSYFLLRQLGYAAAGYLIMIVLMYVDYRFWQNDKVLLLLCSLSGASLVFVLTQPAINHVHRWIRRSSGISFQPSEMAKIVLILFLAAYLHKQKDKIGTSWRPLVVCSIVIALFTSLIAIEPDLGQAICLFVIAASILFVGGLSWKYLIASSLALPPLAYFLVVRVPYRLERIKSFLNMFYDPKGAGWQISQSLTAVGSGGIWGLGLGASKQKYYFLPEAHGDFIFAVVGEELGIIGACALVLAFLFFFYRGMRITLKAPDKFGFYLGFGITLMVVLQAFTNISMVLAMMPTKGTALPFISQGGSSLMLNLLATGILLNISHYSERP